MKHNERILLAESEPIVAMHIESRLAESGFDQPETADSYSKVMQMVRFSRPNLIILDQAMLRKASDLKHAVSLHKKYHVAVVLLVDWMTEELRKLMHRAPYLFVLEKPFVNDDFDRTVIRALSYRTQMN